MTDLVDVVIHVTAEEHEQLEARASEREDISSFELYALLTEVETEFSADDE